MSVVNNGGKMSGNAKNHCRLLITPIHLTELSMTCFRNPIESRSTRQINEHNQKSLPPAESDSAI